MISTCIHVGAISDLILLTTLHYGAVGISTEVNDKSLGQRKDKLQLIFSQCHGHMQHGHQWGLDDTEMEYAMSLALHGEMEHYTWEKLKKSKGVKNEA